MIGCAQPLPFAACCAVLLGACGKSEAPPAPASPPPRTPAPVSAADTAEPTPAADVTDEVTQADGADAGSSEADWRDNRRRCLAGEGPPCLKATHPAAPAAYERRFLKKGCELGVAEACISLALNEAGAEEEVASTIYSPGDMVRLDAMGSLKRACELGHWSSCAALGDRNRAEPCDDDGYDYSDDSDPEVAAAADAKAHELAEKACDGGDMIACRYVAMRALRGCSRGRDVAHGLARLARSLQPKGAECRSGKRLACGALRWRCEAARVAVGEADSEQASVRHLPVSVKASSVLPPWKGYRFNAEQLVDGDLTTSWQPLDKRRGGVDQWFELELGSVAPISELWIANGLQRTDRLGDLFVMNNRVARARVTFSDGTEAMFWLPADTREYTKVKFLAHPTRSIRVTVEGIHRGSKWNDLAVSEVRVYGPEPADPIELPAVCAIADEMRRERCKAGEIAWCKDLADQSDPERGEDDRRRAQEVFVDKCEAAPPDAHACSLAGEALIAIGEIERAAALLERGCRAGEAHACWRIGCHGDDYWMNEDEPDERLNRAAESVCMAGCEAGDDDGCLALAGADPDSPSTVPWDDAWVRKVITRTERRCRSGADCVEEGRKEADLDSFLRQVGTTDVVRAYALYSRGCALGSLDACEIGIELLDRFAEGSPAIERLTKAACPLGSAARCAELAAAGDGEAKATLERVLASLTRECEGGDAEACADASDHVDPAERARLDARRLELLTRGCERGEIGACHEVVNAGFGSEDEASLREKAMATLAARCLEGEGCKELCDVAGSIAANERHGNGWSYVERDEFDLEALSRAAAMTPDLDVVELEDICIEVQLQDPCSCGCC